MKVEVELYAILRKYGVSQEGPFSVDLVEGDRVRRLIELLGIPLEVDRVILINGRPGNLDSILTDGDGVVIFPPLAGG